MPTTNIITLYYVPDVHYYHIPYQSLRPSYSCIALYDISYQPIWYKYPRILLCDYTRNTSITCISFIHTWARLSSLFFLSAKNFCSFSFGFPHISENTSTSITSRFVGQLPITLRFLLWSWSSHDKCSRFHY